jgi:ABC-2 type transport system permease protein
VFIVSQALVNGLLMLSTLFLIAILSSIAFKLAFLPLLGQLWLTLVLVYLPVTCYSLPLIALAWRQRAINTAINAVSLLVIIGSFAINAVLNLHVSNPLLNLISPIYLVNNVFAMLTVGPISQFIATYGVILVILLGLGGFSYRHLKLLPTEGL